MGKKIIINFSDLEFVLLEIWPIWANFFPWKIVFEILELSVEWNKHNTRTLSLVIRFFLNQQNKKGARVNQHAQVHQLGWMDGWCTDRILFSIHVPFQVEFFCLSFLSPDLSFFFWEFYFLPAPHPVSFFFTSFWNISYPPNYYPPIVPHWPTHL